MEHSLEFYKNIPEKTCVKCNETIPEEQCESYSPTCTDCEKEVH